MCGLRKMTASDGDWLRRAEEICAGPISLSERTDMLFAIGKFCNQLLKSAAIAYDRRERTRFVDDMVRSYPKQPSEAACGYASDSVQPVFVVGMMRSGTTLVEQILASHPQVKGFGERGFWNERVRAHENDVRNGMLPDPLRRELAGEYPKTIDRYAAGAARVVDKAPVNADYLGLINSIFPRARIINMMRDPIDTCLSCYFQHFSSGLNFTMELADLAHYHGEHDRLMSHWRSVLPPGAVLDVPYEEHVQQQEKWTRRILAFVGLDWDPQCLKFYETKRRVSTASLWQVRQPMQSDSVARWRNYEPFIKPLLGLRAGR